MTNFPRKLSSIIYLCFGSRYFPRETVRLTAEGTGTFNSGSCGLSPGSSLSPTVLLCLSPLKSTLVQAWSSAIRPHRTSVKFENKQVSKICAYLFLSTSLNSYQLSIMLNKEFKKGRSKKFSATVSFHRPVMSTYEGTHKLCLSTMSAFHNISFIQS